MGHLHGLDGNSAFAFIFRLRSVQMMSAKAATIRNDGSKIIERVYANIAHEHHDVNVYRVPAIMTLFISCGSPAIQKY